MVSIEQVLKDVGTTPNRFVFVFDDGVFISVVDSEALPYYDGATERAVASVTIESFVENGVEQQLSSLPNWVGEIESSIGDGTHSTGYEKVPEMYLDAIRAAV